MPLQNIAPLIPGVELQEILHPGYAISVTTFLFFFFFFCQLFLCDVWSFVLFLTLNFKFTFIFFSLSVDEVLLSSYPLPVVLLIPVIQLLLCIKAVLWKGQYKVLHLCLTSKSDLFSFQIKMLFITSCPADTEQDVRAKLLSLFCLQMISLS